jgi:hypothetical protein
MNHILFVIIYVLYISMIWYGIFSFIWSSLHPMVVFSLYRSIWIILNKYKYRSSPFKICVATLSWLCQENTERGIVNLGSDFHNSTYSYVLLTIYYPSLVKVKDIFSRNDIYTHTFSRCVTYFFWISLQ